MLGLFYAIPPTNLKKKKETAQNSPHKNLVFPSGLYSLHYIFLSVSFLSLFLSRFHSSNPLFQPLIFSVLPVKITLFPNTRRRLRLCQT